MAGALPPSGLKRTGTRSFENVFSVTSCGWKYANPSANALAVSSGVTGVSTAHGWSPLDWALHDGSSKSFAALGVHAWRIASQWFMYEWRVR